MMYLGFMSQEAAPSGDSFTVTAATVGTGDYHATGYAGEEVWLSASPFGSITPSTLNGLGITYFWAFGFVAGDNENVIEFALSDSGGPAASDAFTSVSFVDASSVSRTLNRADAIDPAGTDETTRRAWAWSFSYSNMMSAGVSYTVTVAW